MAITPSTVNRAPEISTTIKISGVAAVGSEKVSAMTKVVLEEDFGKVSAVTAIVATKKPLGVVKRSASKVRIARVAEVSVDLVEAGSAVVEAEVEALVEVTIEEVSIAEEEAAVVVSTEEEEAAAAVVLTDLAELSTILSDRTAVTNRRIKKLSSKIRKSVKYVSMKMMTGRLPRRSLGHFRSRCTCSITSTSIRLYLDIYSVVYIVTRSRFIVFVCAYVIFREDPSAVGEIKLLKF